MKNPDMPARVKETIERTPIMALSTVGSEGSWTSPVRYDYNERLELTFQSMLDTKHVQNILNDSRVSVAIFSYPGPEGGNLGLQIKGRAERITKHASANDWHEFKIMPDEVWCFDTRISRERERII
jgi:general stress protein 26